MGSFCLINGLRYEKTNIKRVYNRATNRVYYWSLYYIPFMSRTPADLLRMAAEDTDIGLNYAHYKPMEAFIKERGFKSGIEIGTAYGGLANHLLSTCELELLITIDPYKYYPDMPGLFDQEDYDRLREQTKFRLYEKYKNVQMYRITSEDFYNKSPAYKHYFDFIFIDGLHKYDTVKWECNHYQNLVKVGGCLMGHDYDIFEDVNKAVEEFANEQQKKLQLLKGNIWYIEY